jgi:hypothetical protein
VKINILRGKGCGELISLKGDILYVDKIFIAVRNIIIIIFKGVLEHVM